MPALELHSRAAPIVEAHHRVNGPDTGRNSGGRQIEKKSDQHGRWRTQFFEGALTRFSVSSIHFLKIQELGLNRY